MNILSNRRAGLALAALLTFGSPTFAQEEVTPDEAREIASDAFLYAYPMLYNYKTLYQQVEDPSFPGYIGGFDRFRHYSRGFTPADTDIVTPSNDTPYSWAWLDLRAEPMVVSVPAAPDRYYVLQWFDLFTHSAHYMGSRATGTEAGDYLLVGPDWNGTAPEGITDVLQFETDIVGTLTRTAWTGEGDRAGLVAQQRQYRIRPLSEFTGAKAAAPGPEMQFPGWDEARANSPDFISYLNFLMQFAAAVSSEQEMFADFAKIGIAPGETFDAGALDPEIRGAIAAGIADAQKELNDTIAQTTSSRELFGTRESLGEDYIMERAVGAAMGIYGNSQQEAVYTAFQQGPDGQLLDSTKKYLLHFNADQVPDVKYFWSMTMYNLPGRLLVENPLGRYAIGSRTDGLKTNPDGSVDIYLQNESPGAEAESNWLPTPETGNFYMILRMYGPQGALLNGSWEAPQPTIVE